MTRLLTTVLNEANPNRLADALRALPVGSALSIVPRTARVVVVPGTGIGVLPAGAKAAAILRCYVSNGTVNGHFTPLATAAAPATTQVGINALGNLQFLIADAVSECEVVYVAAEGVTRTDTIAVAANIGLLPTGVQGKQLLTATDVTAGASTAKTVVARGNAPGAGNASLSIDGKSVRFGDAITLASVTYVAFPAVSVDQALQSQVNI